MTDAVVVGVLYPPEWYRDPDGFAREVAALDALDGVSVVVESYVEPHELRSARGKPDAGSLADQAPALSDAQRRAFSQIDVALAIDLPFEVRSVAPSLRWVQAVGAGTGQLQSSGLADAGIRLTAAVGTSAVSMAEFVFARVLEDLKRLRELEAAQARHHWEPLYGRQLAGRTIGLIGLGAINRAVAVRARPLGLRVLANRRSAVPGTTDPDVDELYPPSELCTMLGQCDIVVAANAGPSMRPTVSGVSGTAATTTSHCPSIVRSSEGGYSSSTSGSVAPGNADRRLASTRRPSGRARTATALLMAPRPISPIVRPASCRP